MDTTDARRLLSLKQLKTSLEVESVDQISGQVSRILPMGGRLDRQGIEYDVIITGVETVPTAVLKPEWTLEFIPN